ncbi:hypothetical protein [Deinococcus apachensis]|uniref:phage major capsid protein n=1 Tax=Deinococcus apachensis TaxID=309886 RepID=UPI00036FEDAB|nr:hypothetical protein [Deinococcus apachensis]
MSKIRKLADITLALKKEAQAANHTFAQHLQHLADNGEIDEGLYDPNVRNSAGQSVDAWKQLIVRGAGLQPKGRNAATTVNDAFFRQDDNRILFPLYIEERYREVGRESRNGLVLADVVTDVVPVEASVVATQLLSFTDDENADLARVAEGAEYPVLTITQGDAVVRLLKYGGRLEASLEAVLNASLSTLDRWLLKVRRQADRNKIRKALDILRNGDGNNNAAPNVAAAGASLTPGDFIALLMKSEGYGADPAVLTGSTEALGTALSMEGITGAAATAGEDFRQTGTFPLIYGMRPKLPPQRSVLTGTRQLMAIDPAAALTQHYDPRFDLVRYEDIIRRDLTAVQITEMLGFSKPDQGAAITLTLQ